jgi:PTH1 family peptidyl-tRNA hydrolase
VVIFGLGNPGKEYARTRHNLGFMVTDALARAFGARFRKRKAWHEAKVSIGGAVCALVKPTRFMNLSGEVVKDYLALHQGNRQESRNQGIEESRNTRILESPNPGVLSPEFLVACDDLALPFGKLRIRTRGSDGGHNGLANIIYHLGHGSFPRLRMGIGAVPEGMDPADYVLSEFIEEERRALPDVVEAGKDALVMVVEHGITAAMNQFNSWELVPADDTNSST